MWQLLSLSISCGTIKVVKASRVEDLVKRGTGKGGGKGWVHRNGKGAPNTVILPLDMVMVHICST